MDVVRAEVLSSYLETAKLLPDKARFYKENQHIKNMLN